METKDKKRTLKMIFRILVIVADGLLVPALVLCRWLSEQMLSAPEAPCYVTLFGGKCITCGGTHFVYDLLSGKIITAFMDNQFLFICTLYLFVTLIMLNLFLVFNLDFAKKVLKYMYNIPVLIGFIVFLFLFIFIRNIPMIIHFSGIAYRIGVEMIESISKGDWEGAVNNPTLWKTLRMLVLPLYVTFIR